MSNWIPAYVGLGSNLDDPERQVALAFAALERLPESRLVLRSGLYRSAPVGPVEQPDFINAVAGMLTRLPARELLAALKDLEAQLGRARPVVRWGPRRIDLDLLVYGNERHHEPELEVPHPGIASRAFVLMPLAEIAPALQVPGRGRVAKLLQDAGSTEVERIAA